MSKSISDSDIAGIYRHLPPRRRRQLFLLLALMVVGAFAELVAIGSIVPFLSLLADPSRLDRLAPVTALFQWLNADTSREQLIVVSAIFAVAVLGASVIRLLLSWATQSFVFAVGHDFSMAVHQRMLYQPYAFHAARNSSELIAAQEKILSLAITVLLPIMNAVAAAVISVFIIGILFYIDPVVALIAGTSISVFYFGVSYFTRQRLHRNSAIVNSTYSQRVKAVQESLGGIRDILIDQSQPLHLAYFADVNLRFRRAQVANGVIGSAPRFVVEGVGMVVIALLAVVMSSRSGGFAAALPVLGALALSAQRLLPLLQQIYYGWAQIRSNWALVADLLELLNLEQPLLVAEQEEADLPFQHEIRFEQVSFRYPGRDEWALSKVDLVIPRGTSVALVGKTGSGKSTLVDILMGLLEPTDGSLTIDGVQPVGANRIVWQKQIAHVPQFIFLADTTIEQNIAFGAGYTQVDQERVREAARLAQIQDFIESLPEGYRTPVGERGVRLSGGQRQRIGIARALYKRAPVLVLDEATSALDQETEAAVMSGLAGLGEALTIVMIAHRLTTVAKCDMIVRLEDGNIDQIGTYTQVIGKEGKLEMDRKFG